MASIEFTAFARTTEGRGASRRMRKAGKAPGIVYGGKGEPTPIELDHNALIHALRNEAFHASILTMKLDGSATKVLLRDVQMHPFKNEVLHVDFQRIDESRKIHMKVPLHFVNAEVSPAVKEAGAVINHVMNEIQISCLPADLPEFIEVDLAQITVARSIHARELNYPKGVEPVLHRGEDPVVASAALPKAVLAEEEEVAAAAEMVPASQVPAAKQQPEKPETPAAAEKPEKPAKGDKGERK